MNKIFSFMGVVALLLTMSACRPESDTLVAYDHNDRLVFAEADTSFAAKFKIMWNGMNQYYAIWDYEAEQGLDWDAVYDEYLPQFEALDKRDKNATVTDDELYALLQKCLGKLHDGHFFLDMLNHRTGHIVKYYPNKERNASREDFPIASTCFPNISYYANVANGQVETDANGAPIVKAYSTKAEAFIQQFLYTPGIGLNWVNDQIAELDRKSTRLNSSH